jgi:hypothetical protein
VPEQRTSGEADGPVGEEIQRVDPVIENLLLMGHARHLRR